MQHKGFSEIAVPWCMLSDYAICFFSKLYAVV